MSSKKNLGAGARKNRVAGIAVALVLGVSAFSALVQSSGAAIADPTGKIKSGVEFIHSARGERSGYVRAEKCFSAAIAATPDEPEAWSRRCEARVLLHNYEGAVADGTKALELAPRYWHPLMFRGQAYHGLGRYEDSVQDYRTILEDSPDFFWAPELMAYSLLAMGKGSDAIEAFKRSHKSGPQRLHVMHRLGMTYLLLGDYEAAAQTFRNLNGLWGQHGLCVANYLRNKGADEGGFWKKLKQMAGGRAVEAGRPLPPADTVAAVKKLRAQNPGWMEGALLEFAWQAVAGEKAVFTPPLPPPAKWVENWAAFGMGAMGLDNTLSVVKHPDNDQETRARQADCYLLAGYKAIANKDEAAAKEMFKKAAVTAPLLSYAHILGKVECVALDPGVDVSSLAPAPMLVIPARTFQQ